MTLSVITPRHIALMRHVLGLPDQVTEGARSYRNRYFIFGAGGRNWQVWTGLVTLGLAEQVGQIDRGMTHFRLTRAGAELALGPGEILDSEDFPG